MLILTLWTVGSVLLFAVGAQVAWRLRSPLPGRVGQWVWGVANGRARPWLDAVFKALYFAGLPVLALFLGVADLPIQWGLSGFDWFSSVGQAVAVLAVGLTLLCGGSAYVVVARARMGAPVAGLPRPDLLFLLWESIGLELHWALYRLAPILATGDWIWGTAIGVGLAIVEQTTDPKWRSDASAPDTRPEAWLRVATQVVMGGAFVLVRNLFLLVALHWVLELARRTVASRVSWGEVARAQSEARERQEAVRTAPPIPGG